MAKIRSSAFVCPVACSYCGELGGLGFSRAKMQDSFALLRGTEDYWSCSAVALDKRDWDQLSPELRFSERVFSDEVRVLLMAQSPRSYWAPYLERLQNIPGLRVSLVVARLNDGWAPIVRELEFRSIPFEVLFLVRRSVAPDLLLQQFPLRLRERISLWFPRLRASGEAKGDFPSLAETLLLLTRQKYSLPWRIEDPVAAEAVSDFFAGKSLLRRPFPSNFGFFAWASLLRLRFGASWGFWLAPFSAAIFSVVGLRVDPVLMLRKSLWRLSDIFWFGTKIFWWFTEMLWFFAEVFWWFSEIFWLAFRGVTQAILRIKRLFWKLHHWGGLARIQLEAWMIRLFWASYHGITQLPVLYWTKIFRLLYPVRKIFYFLHYQWQKRIWSQLPTTRP